MILKLCKKILFGLSIFLAIITSGCQKQDEFIETNNQPVTIELYYLNVCGSCEPEKELLAELQNKCGVDIYASNITIQFYNIYDEYNEARWKSTLEELGDESNEINTPVVKIGKYLYSLSKSEGSEIAGALQDETDETLIKTDDSIIILFTSPGCSECEQAEDDMKNWPKTIALGDIASSVRIVRYSIDNSQNAQKMRQYCIYYDVPEKEQQTPIVFGGQEFLQGYNEIKKELLDLLASGECLDTPLFSAYIEESIDDTAEALTWYSVLGVGLANGINPCAISMLLLFMSLVIAKQKWLLQIGFSFALGKLIGFFLLGTILYRVLDTINYDTYSSTVKIVLLAIVTVMIFLNLNDFLAAKREKYKNIILQLPQPLRKVNHTLIHKISSVNTKRWIIVGSFSLGLLLSFGEFLCTGQLYLAIILGMVHSSSLHHGAAMAYLFLYSIAFIVPIIILTILLYKGRKLFDITEFFREREALIKLINVGIFIALGIIIFVVY